MTPEDFKQKMGAINARDGFADIERNHKDADLLLCDALKQLGYGAGVKIFKDMEKWYA